MKQTLMLMGALLTSVFAEASTTIVPCPVSVKEGKGSYTITPATRVSYTAEELAPLADYLASYLDPALGARLEVSRGGSARDAIRLELKSKGLPAEGYELTATAQGIRIAGRDYGGVFNGIQTLLQLLPAPIYAKAAMSEPLTVEGVTVRDWPRFSYRSMMLDCARTFVPVEHVKRYIDYLAYHKINTFRWHLTDDEAWRIEIKSHPELATVAGYRGGDSPILPIYGKWDEKWGGYYTQEQMRDVVDYAALRHIVVIPEIELPGHSRAMARVHPEILCNYESDNSRTNGYDRRSAWCVSKESNYQLLREIFEEVCAIFPSPVIHVGGDEVVMDQWKSCPDCTSLMERNGWTDFHKCEDHFMAHMQQILSDYGKRMGVWNEAINGGSLSRDNIVYAWQNPEAALKSTGKGYPTVVMPGQWFYFDMKQTPEEPGHNWAAIFDAMKPYSWDFEAQGFTPEQMNHVIGVEATFFSEAYIAHDPQKLDYLEYMTFPRICSLSEVAWTTDRRDADTYYALLNGPHAERLAGMGIHFRAFPPQVTYADGVLTVNGTSPHDVIRYTNDGRTTPHAASALYTGPIRTDRPQDYRFVAFPLTGMSPVVCTVPRYDDIIKPEFRLTSSFRAEEKAPFANVEGYRTFTRTDRTCSVGDWVLFTFTEPVDCSSFELITGYWELPAYQMTGTVEVSYDGVHFLPAGSLSNGRITLYPEGPVRAVRLTSTADGNGHASVFIHYPRIHPRG